MMWRLPHFALLAVLLSASLVNGEIVLVPATVTNGLDAIPNHKVLSYSVADILTGDKKSAEEVRVGDLTKGSYSLAQNDGVLRNVVYTSDPIPGFQADVTYSRPSIHPATVVVAPTIQVVPASIVISSLDAVAIPGASPRILSKQQVLEDGVPAPVIARLASSKKLLPKSKKLSRGWTSPLVISSPGPLVPDPVVSRFASSNLALGDPRVSVIRKRESRHSLI